MPSTGRTVAGPLAGSVSKKEQPGETLEMFPQLENTRDSSNSNNKKNY